MQAFINIIYELARNYIDAYFAAHPPACCFIDRGDPSTPDFQLGDLNGDNTWHDLDLSSIVPANTDAVLFRVSLQSSSSLRVLSLRTKGNTGWPNVAYCNTQNLNDPISFDKQLFLDDTRKIQYRFNSTYMDFIQITVAAWHLGDFSTAGFLNRGDPAVDDFTESDFPAHQTWTDLDLSAVLPAGTQCILLRCRAWSTSNQRSLRFRTKGHSNSINISQCEAVESGLNYYYDIQVPTNGLQTIQYWCSLGGGAVVRLSVKGWWYG